MTTYEPTIGQLCYGAPWSHYTLPDYAEALFHSIREEVTRVYWNREQTEWEEYDDPDVTGITWRPYYWGDDETEASKPNFTFEDVEIRWYKRPGRGMSTNVEWEPAQWVAWFDRCIAVIRQSEE